MANFKRFRHHGKANNSTELRNLHRYATEGDWWEVKQLLNDLAEINELNVNVDTPLHLACQHLKYDVIQVLIDHNASTDIQRSKDGRTVLHLTCELRTVLPGHQVDELIQRSGNVCLQDDYGDAALHLACWNGETDVAIAQLLIEQGADVGIGNVDGIRPIHVACAERNIKMLMCLLANGAKVNIADKYLNTPLSIARIQRFGQGVDVLLNHRAEWMIGERFGDIPVGKVTKINKSEFCRVYANANGNTAFHAASLRCDITFADIALSQGHDINHRNSLRLSALDLAVLCGHQSMVSMLSENGAALNSVGLYGRSALHLAIDKLVESCLATCQPVERIPDKWPRRNIPKSGNTHFCCSKTVSITDRLRMLTPESPSNVRTYGADRQLYLNIIRSLLVRGANLNTVFCNLNNVDNTVTMKWHAKCFKNAGDMTEYGIIKLEGHLVVRCFEISDSHHKLETPLTVACGLRSPERRFVDEPLKRGADPNPKGVPQPLLVALGSGNTDLIDFLVAYGTDVKPYLKILDTQPATACLPVLIGETTTT